jgi:hypothetical protein
MVPLRTNTPQTRRPRSPTVDRYRRAPAKSVHEFDEDASAIVTRMLTGETGRSISAVTEPQVTPNRSAGVAALNSPSFNRFSAWAARVVHTLFESPVRDAHHYWFAETGPSSAVIPRTPANGRSTRPGSW